ncbi:hypothetical protein D9758_018724 [Tetrapyrgos nigripes]|uniref:Uncharacterized protein n=1 Tax=Tetrapyrgos nigripes TaxID=182062 RepID=A0A8H5F0P4_9AGAR|nr:hypothetical protein D9758_018724 [Tetrapyrgos nigripes]
MSVDSPQFSYLTGRATPSSWTWTDFQKHNRYSESPTTDDGLGPHFRHRVGLGNATLFFIDSRLSDSEKSTWKNQYHIDKDFFECCDNRVFSRDDRIVTPDDNPVSQEHTRITFSFLHTGPDDLTIDFIGIYVVKVKHPSGHSSSSSPSGIEPSRALPSSNPVTLPVILCYFPHTRLCTTALKSWFKDTRADNSKLWDTIVDGTKEDVSVLLLPILWFTVYAWADALAKFYQQANGLVSVFVAFSNPCQEFDMKSKEEKILDSLDSQGNTKSLSLTKELHKLRNRLHYYRSQLRSFKKIVASMDPILEQLISTDSVGPGDAVITSSKDFIYFGTQTTRFMIRDSSGFTLYMGSSDEAPKPEASDTTRTNQVKYCQYSEMVREIERLFDTLMMRNDRMRDVMGMVFSYVTISDSKAMKQIASLTMYFIPPTFVAGIFGMNLKPINADKTPIWIFFVIAVPLTIVTLWFLKAGDSSLIAKAQQKLQELGLGKQLTSLFHPKKRTKGEVDHISSA